MTATTTPATLTWKKTDRDHLHAESCGHKFVLYPIGDDWVLSIDDKTAKRGTKGKCKAEANRIHQNALAQHQVDINNEKEDRKSLVSGNLVWLPDSEIEEGNVDSFLHWTTSTGKYRVTRCESPDGEVRIVATVCGDSGKHDTWVGSGESNGHPKEYDNLQEALDACLGHHRKVTKDPGAENTGTDVLIKRAGVLGKKKAAPKAPKTKRKASGGEGEDTPKGVVQEAPGASQTQETTSSPSEGSDNDVQDNEKKETEMTTATATVVKIKEKSLRTMFLEMGFKAAKDWDIPKLQAATKKVGKYIDKATKDVEGDSLTLLRQVSEAICEGNEVKILASPGRKAVAKEEVKEDAEVKVKAAKTKVDEEKPEANKKEKTPKAKTDGAKKLKVSDSIRDWLKDASEKKPLTLEKIHKLLVVRFPDRDPDKMMSTLKVEVPWRLKVRKGHDVRNDGKGGWWIAK